MDLGHLIWIAIALPLASSIFIHFAGRFLRRPLAGILASFSLGGVFVLALAAAFPFFRGGAPGETVMLWEWMPAIGASIEILWDPLAAMMTLIVTGVGTLIHIFAIGYMHDDERFHRFFAILNLFAASMLTLVLAGNYAMLFLGWELVGLCSYLLVGFWFTRPSAAAAAKKALVVNRIGDFGLIIGLMLVFAVFGTLSYAGVSEQIGSELTTGMATAIILLFLAGAAGKSAQIPLYVWLPDAMEGPTPVSALIHAATMVTSGVYLLARSAAILEMTVTGQIVIATVGAATALWAATIAISQRDIKKVLAYSTVSQLGYMILAVGAAAYVAGLFHLMTHAFFKALLFLGAGSVIHAMNDEQDMHKMGGLFSKTPITAITMGIATLAIAGIPPLGGFWSKDEILASVFERGGFFLVLWVVGLFTALITGFYMTRQFVMVFMGKPRWDDDVDPHEPPRVMTIPLVILALLSAAGGFINTPIRLTLEHFLEPSFEGVQVAHGPDSVPLLVLLAALAVFAGVIGLGAAYVTYRRDAEDWERFEDGLQPVWGVWEGAYRVDDIYGAAIVAPGARAAEVAAFKIDLPIIDGAVNGAGRMVRIIGNWVRPLQTGYVRNYGTLLLAGAVVIAVWLVVGGA